MLQGKENLVPVNTIKLDAQNPRIGDYVEGAKKLTQEDLENFLQLIVTQKARKTKASFQHLKKAIEAAGGLIEPIHIRKIKKEKDFEYQVIEGNTRTVIYRLLQQEQPNDPKWKKIRATIYDQNISDEQVDEIILQAHIIGKVEWSPYNRSKYLHDCYHKKHMTHQELGDKLYDLCGGRRSNVEKEIAAYEQMQKTYKPLCKGDDFETDTWSGFYEYQVHKDALERRARITKKQFAQWTKKGLVRPLRVVRKLPEIVKDSKIKRIFERDGGKKALDALTAKQEPPLAHENLDELIDRILLHIDSISDKKKIQMAKSGKTIRALQTLESTLDEFLKEMDDFVQSFKK